MMDKNPWSIEVWAHPFHDGYRFNDSIIVKVEFANKNEALNEIELYKKKYPSWVRLYLCRYDEKGNMHKKLYEKSLRELLSLAQQAKK